MGTQATISGHTCWPQTTPFTQNISTTVHAMTKLFVPFCSAQDGESTDVNCLAVLVHCENGKFLTKHQVYNKGISRILGSFSKYKISIPLNCTVESE